MSETHISSPINRTLWLYWDRGVDAMPELLQHIYKHNMAKCREFGWHVVLLTKSNIWDHIVPDARDTKNSNKDDDNHDDNNDMKVRFATMTPYEQADYVRAYVLRDYGGVWLDSDFIVTGNLDKLMALMDIKQQQNGYFERACRGHFTSKELVIEEGALLAPGTFLAIREHLEGCKGSAVLAAKRGSSVAVAYVDRIECKLASKSTLRVWGEIGPGILREVPEEYLDEFRVINDVTAFASVNFCTWYVNPGYKLHTWLKESPELARDTAEAIAHYDIPIVGTWSLYRQHLPELSQEDLVRMVFEDDCSVFKALLEVGQ